MDPNSSHTKYVIALDAIDLNYIPTVNRYKGSEVTQIWTKGNLDQRDKNYYEFEIKENNLECKDGVTAIMQRPVEVTMKCNSPGYHCAVWLKVSVISDNLVQRCQACNHSWRQSHGTTSPSQSSHWRPHRIKDECENAQYTYTTCHICSVDVPKPFLKEHFHSKKHITFKKIIDISLERLKKIIEQDVFEHSNISDSVYFCTSCVAVIQINQKILHEKSLAHKNALMVDNFLNDFLDLYDDGKKSSNDCDNDNNNIQSNNKVPINIEKVPVVNNAAANDKIKIEDVTNNSNNKAVRIERITNEITAVSKVHDSKKNLEAYIDFLINTTNLKNIKILESHNLEIKTISGAKVKIMEFHFNSTINQSKKLYRCILCSEIIQKTKKWDHVYEKKHVQLVTIPFENENCMRRIDNSWSHCALCNKEIQDQEEHISSDKDHKLRLDEALQINTDTIAVECPDNDVETASTSKQKSKGIEENNIIAFKEVEPYLKSNDVEINIDCIEKKNEIHKFNYLFYLSDNANKDYICRVCKSLIGNSYFKVIEHMYSTYHTENYTKLLLLNNIGINTENIFRCTACKLTVLKSLELIHINCKEHQQNLASVVEIGKEKANPSIIENQTLEIVPDTVLLKIDGHFIEGNSFKCAICSMSVPSSNYNIYTHLATARHITAVTKLPSNSVIAVHYHIDLANFPEITCMVCDVGLTLNERNINTHINGYIHKKNYKLKLEDNKIVKNVNNYTCKICSVSISPTNELIHCQTKKHIHNLNVINSNVKKCNDSEGTSEAGSLAEVEEKTYLLMNFGHPKQLFCIVCNVKIPNTSNNIRTHLRGSAHTEIFNRTLDSNYIFNSCDYYECELCKMFIVTGKEFLHISTKIHEDNIKNAMKHKCVVCQVILTKNIDNIRLHNSGDQHKNMVELAANNNIRISEDKCFCDTCEKYINNESIGAHLNNEYHIMHSFSNGN